MQMNHILIQRTKQNKTKKCFNLSSNLHVLTVSVWCCHFQVLQAISKALDDSRRAVRQEAVRCRQAWSVLDLSYLPLMLFYMCRFSFSYPVVGGLILCLFQLISLDNILGHQLHQEVFISEWRSRVFPRLGAACWTIFYCFDFWSYNLPSQHSVWNFRFSLQTLINSLYYL